MSESPIKCIILQSKLNEQIPSYNFANNETRNGLWQIAVKEIAIAFNEDINLISHLSCNLVKDVRFKDFERESFNSVMCTNVLKGKSGEKKIFQIDRTWFQVNRPNTEIKLVFTNPESNTVIQQNCEVFVSLLLQQIK